MKTRVSLCLTFLLLTLLFCGGSGQAASLGARISAHLTATSFTSAKASKTKLIYSFSSTSRHFSYLLTRKAGSKWKSVKQVKKTGSFSGKHTMTVKKVFGGKAIKVGKYRLRLSADSGGKTLSFTVKKASGGGGTSPGGGGTTPGGGGTTPTGSVPANTALPAISGNARQGQTLSTTKGSWNGAPTSYAYQWERCNAAGASCADISGAAGSSYVLAASDIGSTLRIGVTATNSTGSATTNSVPTALVVPPPPANTVLPLVSGTPKQGQRLT